MQIKDERDVRHCDELNQTWFPPVTVVIATRNRGTSVSQTIQSILRLSYPQFELRMIDQSDDDGTEIAVQAFLSDPRFHYTRSATKGLATAHKTLIREARNEFIAITDDDCEVPVDWIHQMVSALRMHQRIAIIFGNVLAAEHDRNAGFIPAYTPCEPFLARSIRDKNRTHGIGACMGLRRSVWQTLGGFDQMLGTGAPFKDCEEGDFAIRALLAGYFVYETPQVTLVHHGFRNWAQGRSVAYRNWFGTGACMIKLLKCGQWSTLPVIDLVVRRIAIGQLIRNVISGRRPFGLTCIVAFMAGFLAGSVSPVDPDSVLYLDRGSSFKPPVALMRGTKHA